MDIEAISAAEVYLYTAYSPLARQREKPALCYVKNCIYSDRQEN